jgi:iron complex outermembrane receptor protein
VKGLTVETGYFRIDQTDIVGAVSTVDVLQDVELNGPASAYASRVRFGSFNGTPVTAAGQISAAYDGFGTFSGIFVTSYAENFVTAKQDGIDLRTEYVFNVERLGKFDLEFTGLWYNKFDVDGTDYVGQTNGQSVLNGGTIPRWQANLHATWERGDYLVGFNLQYIPSVTDPTADPSETDPGFDADVESFYRLDVFGRYTFRGVKWLDGLTLRLGVNNVFDRMPPLAGSSWTDANADTATYGCLGRVIYVDASYKF